MFQSTERGTRERDNRKFTKHYKKKTIQKKKMFVNAFVYKQFFNHKKKMALYAQQSVVCFLLLSPRRVGIERLLSFGAYSSWKVSDTDAGKVKYPFDSERNEYMMGRGRSVTPEICGCDDSESVEKKRSVIPFSKCRTGSSLVN